MGVCVCTVKEIKDSTFTVAIKRKGKEEAFRLDRAHILPNWTDNQDLFAEMMVAKNGSSCKTNVGVVFEAAEKTKPERARPTTVPANTTPEPVAESVPLAAAPTQKPTPKPVQPPPKPQARTIQRLIVSIDCADGWECDLRELKKAIADKAMHEERLAFHRKALEEHDGLVSLCAKELEDKGVTIVWTDTVITAAPVAQPKPKAPTESGAVKSPRQTLVDGMTGRMVPLKRYTLQELDDLLERDNDKTFTNHLYWLMKTTNDFDSEKTDNVRYYFMK